jgi:hypothetical protein
VAVVVGPYSGSETELRVACHVDWCRGVFDAAYAGEWEKAITLWWSSEEWLELYARGADSGTGIEYELRTTPRCGGQVIGEGLVAH